MWVWEIAGGGYFGGTGRGHPTPRNFLDKKCYFSLISTKFDFIWLKKILGVGTPSLGAPSPLKLFLDFRTRWNLVYFMHMFETFFSPLGVNGVEFRRLGTSVAARKRKLATPITPSVKECNNRLRCLLFWDI